LIFTKTLAGLRIQSDIALPDLAEPDAISPEFGLVRIRIVDIGELISRRNRAPDDRNFTLKLPGIGEFLVPGPNEILVAPDAHPAERAIAWFLLGPCFAAIAYWNRVLPLHAGAIDTPEGCIAFAGSSGAGKSTLVHRLIAEGYPVRSDDVCFVRATDDGQIMVWPGVRLLRLAHEPAANGVPARKHCVALPPLAHPTQPVRLRAVYVLHAAAGGNGGEIARLWGARAAEQCIANAYRMQIAARLGLIANIVPSCVNIAASTPVYRYSRAMGFEALPESLRRLTTHFSTRADSRAD
jgi:hypothetical protein